MFSSPLHEILVLSDLSRRPFWQVVPVNEWSVITGQVEIHLVCGKSWYEAEENPGEGKVELG